MRKLPLALIFLTACGGGPGGIGDACNPDAADSCQEELVCAPDEAGDDICQVPLGGECDSAADPSECVFGSECVDVTEVDPEGNEVMLARCFISEGGVCDPTMPEFCAPGLSCAELVDGTYQCHVPLLMRGRVLDAADLSGIPDAHVIGLDDESVAVTDIAVSELDGTYELEVPIVREADGTPITENFTLRGSADGYQNFPGGIRTALPINSSEATRLDEGWVIEGTITDVVLIELADPSAPRVTVSGHVISDGPVGGVLVVADMAGVGHSAVSSATGAYTIFNVPPGDYEVRGYAADLQLTPVGISATTDLTDVDLIDSGAAGNTLSGSINIVNAFGGAVTSVVLVVESTFSDTFGRGEVPPGLRAPRTGPVSISGDWTITGVPDGRYVVLAAFENDLLVRDPDQNIAGTGTVTVDLPADGTDVTLMEAFKVTEALAVVGPGADLPEAVSAAPMLVWADDSSEEYYTVQVYNAYGELAWEDLMVPAVSGSPNVTVMYGGTLEAGMYYQFRATSWRAPGGGMPSAISATEDLLGVFHYQP